MLLKKWLNRVLYPLILFFSLLWTQEVLLAANPPNKTSTKKYVHNPHVPLTVWQQLEPYFLPIDHPIKSKLDHLFHSKRITLNKKTFEAAGFAPIHERAPTNVIIGRHPKLKGYIIKAYLDTQPAFYEWAVLMDRIRGAESIRSCLKRHQYKQFVVPRKWLYPLPCDPSPPSGSYNRKNFILIVEDMQILDHPANLKAYQKKITPQILNALYTILKEEGLLDSVYLDNIPFTRLGQIAFIDTEHYHKEPIDYLKLKPFFSASMQRYWQTLVEKGGP